MALFMGKTVTTQYSSTQCHNIQYDRNQVQHGHCSIQAHREHDTGLSNEFIQAQHGTQTIITVLYDGAFVAIFKQKYGHENIHAMIQAQHDRDSIQGQHSHDS
jgi:hypothetical protein